MNHNRINRGVGSIDPILVVFAQTPIVAQPSKCALGDPTPRDHLKTGQVRQTRRNLNINSQGTGLLNKRSGIGAIRPQLFEAGKALLQTGQQPDADGAIVIVGFAHKGFENQPFRIHNQMAFAPFDTLTAIIASYAPFSVVLTDWLSMLPALGVASRPNWRRSCSRKASFIRAHVPSLRQVLK
jgi:hypothetical protein